ncbi:MAG: phosphate regulon sensor histidine kinase PhoR [Lysobacteraceae bacterium]|nr:MAG: phosphate regulon sensor histidine kinase PhoR [Xanthomonadaceae bacterium]
MLFWFSACGVLALILGAVTGWWTLMIALWLGTYLAWNALNLYRLDRWASGQSSVPPESDTVWGGIYANLAGSRKRARRRHRRLLNLVKAFRKASSILPDATILVRKDLTVDWFNDQATSLLGFRRPTDLNQPITNVLRMPRFKRWLLDSMASPGTPMETAAPTDPEVQHLYILIPYAPGQFLLLVRDVSKLRKLEQVRRDFVANVSHELRTPLTVVHGYLEALEGDVSEQWEPIVGTMQKQTQRMQAIVEDLLTLSRLETGDRAPDGSIVDIAALLHTLKQEAMALSSGRHTIKFSRNSDKHICGVEKELYSAFSNLIANAIRYTPEGGTIDVQWNDTQSGCELLVRDNGNGIQPHHVRRITERFYRVSPDRSRNSGGTGLGLSIVKHALGRHQAQLIVESEVGVGSRFKCLFPAERLKVVKVNDRQPEESVV